MARWIEADAHFLLRLEFGDGGTESDRVCNCRLQVIDPDLQVQLRNAVGAGQR